jgi:hypothetical protein
MHQEVVELVGRPWERGHLGGHLVEGVGMEPGERAGLVG